MNTMATVMEWFTRFPALWGIAGIVLTLVGGGVGVLVTIIVLKKYGPAAAGAAKELIALQERAGQIQKETLQMQREHFEQEIRFLKQELQTTKEESKQYETTLHDKRNEWNGEKLLLVAENEKLKNRPNIDTLYEFETKAHEIREKFYGQLGETLKNMSETLTNHEASATDRIKPMMDTLVALLAVSKKQSKVLGIILRENREERAKKKETDKTKA